MHEQYIKPFLIWVHQNQIQTFVDVVGDIMFICLAPIAILCGIKYLLKG